MTKLEDISAENIILRKAIYDCKDKTISFLTSLAIALEKMLSAFAQCNVDAYRMLDKINDNRRESLSIAIDNVSILHTRIKFNTNRVRQASQYTNDSTAAEYRTLVSKMKQEQGSMANFILSYFPQAIKGSANIYLGGVANSLTVKKISKTEAANLNQMDIEALENVNDDSSTNIPEIIKSASLHAMIGGIIGRVIKKRRDAASVFFEQLS